MKAFVYCFCLSVIALVIALAFMFTLSLPASAAQQCAPLATVLSQLAEKWQEVPRGRGLAKGGAYVVTLLHDRAGDTWTILGVTANGTACILATGTAWEPLAPAPLGTEG